MVFPSSGSTRESLPAAMFVTQLDTHKVAEATEFRNAIWELHTSLVFESSVLGTITVPAGFRTDFATVPRLPLAFLVAGDRAHASAAVHDWLLERGMAPDVAAHVFGEAMKAEGVPAWRRHLMYLAVRWFGPLNPRQPVR